MRPILREIGSSITFPRNVNLEIDLPDDLPKVLVDETQIGIAFRNLIKNARDAMPDGGTIRITSELQDDALILSVTDQGTGISEEILETIFEPLFTTKARGMGLGLSITLAIVEKNQGKLMIDSEVGKGTKFSVSLKPNPVNTVSTN